MKNRFLILISILLIISFTWATRAWTPEEIQKWERKYRPNLSCRLELESLLPGPRRFNYLQRIKWTCDFVARYQVSDTNSPHFGGIIEAEHLPNIIETDNTQEAIWIWTRWYQLTGRDDYRENIRRAWIYVLRNPAYREHSGNPVYTWYAVWNCGLGLWTEALYRKVYQDTTFQFYADSCRNFYLRNPLSSTTYLNNLVTAQASGMAYNYARERNDQELLDTALARGIRIKNWIESNARFWLGYQEWAMCGGTAFWGISQTFCQHDTVAGKNWIRTYVESLPGFYPSGNWNCSHNIWLAYAFYAAADIAKDRHYQLMHKYLTDTLLMKDLDLDGGIPATWTDPPNQDQTWISTYLDFMGMDMLATPVYDYDLSMLNFVQPKSDTFYLIGDTINLIIPVANTGRYSAGPTTVTLLVSSIPYDSIRIDSLPFIGVDTLTFIPLPIRTPGEITIVAALPGDDNPLNDTTKINLKIYRHCLVTGVLWDSTYNTPVQAKIKAYLYNRTTPWDSTTTDSFGRFSINLFDSLFTLTVEPQVPYSRRSFQVRLSQDTTITLLIPLAQVIIVNADTTENYNRFYTSTLDTLNIKWCLWNRRNSGILPYPLLRRLERKTIIWYSGNATNQPVPTSDQESLTVFIADGGNLLMTGQNIAQELAGTHFLENTIGCRFDSSGWQGFLVFGQREDSLGQLIPGTATAGGGGANNQTSRDIISPTGNSTVFVIYDTTTYVGAGIKREATTGGRVIFLGFGFEAVNRPPSRPQYLTRVQLMELLLNWLFTGTGLSELPQKFKSSRKPVIKPVIFTDHILISTPTSLTLSILNSTGRMVARFTITAGTNNCQLSHLPPGVYFVQIENYDYQKLVKIR